MSCALSENLAHRIECGIWKAGPFHCEELQAAASEAPIPVSTISLAGDEGLGEKSGAGVEYTQAREDPRRGEVTRWK